MFTGSGGEQRSCSSLFGRNWYVEYTAFVKRDPEISVLSSEFRMSSEYVVVVIGYSELALGSRCVFHARL